MRKEGYTQQEIGDRIGWSRSKVADYNRIIDNVGHIIDKAKEYQQGRTTQDVGTPTFNFTETWFRNLYQLNAKYQERLLNDFINDKFNWNNSKVKSDNLMKMWYFVVQTWQNLNFKTTQLQHFKTNKSSLKE